MKIAHIIIFHEDETLIERIIQSMYHPDFDFYLHLDGKVDRASYQKLSSLPNTYFIMKRKKVSWGGYSQVEAICNSLEQIFLPGSPQYDFINLLSGQDYPIKPIDQIHGFLLNNRGKSFIMSETPPSPWWDHAFTRFNRYHFVDFPLRGRYRLSTLLSKLLPKRKFPLRGELYGGPEGAYWILSSEAAKYVLKSLMDEKVRKFFRYTWGPDEFLINTILMNSAFKETIVNENYHLIDRSLGGTRPKILHSNDFDMLKVSNKFFARKFDRKVDEKILDRIDSELLNLPGIQNRNHHDVQEISDF
jgi:hypothetical protein